MEREHNIALLDLTNFLNSGALLRHRDEWTLIEGPFKPVSVPNSSGISVFCPDFYETNQAVALNGQVVHQLSTSEMQSLFSRPLSVLDPQKALATALWQEPSKSDFSESLNQIQKRMTEGQIQKAVPVVFARASHVMTATDKHELIRQLITAPATLYAYGFWNAEGGVLGATPEVLLEYENQTLKTMALAGTCPKSEKAERSDLMNDEKERLEHELVVQDIVAQLKVLGSVQTAGPRVLELPTLFHLQTDIQVQCAQEPDILSLIKKLHPTPALGVSPRSAGIEWMQELPGQEGRARFGAPFAFIQNKGALCLVGIRNLQWNRNLAMIGSGCGVVAASELEREWRELQQKRLSVRKILGLDRD